MKVKEIMTTGHFLHCGPKTKLKSAAKIMRDADYSELPVLDKNKKVVGMISNKDLARTLAQKNPETVIKSGSVGEIMSKKNFSINENEDIYSALYQMKTNDLRRLPVVDKLGKFKGIISCYNPHLGCPLF